MIVIVSALMISTVNAQLNTAVQVAVDTNKAAKAAQVRIDKLSNQTEDLTGQYRNILNQIESMRSYNKQLEALVDDQRSSIDGMNAQMTHLEQTNRGVIPMIIEMVDALNEIVDADLPFKYEERKNRVSALEDMLNSADFTTAEKYRKVTEVYGVELDYGKTVDAYRGNLPDGKKVDFIRIGRTSLVYQTLNQEESGWLNPNTRKFEKLDNQHNSDIKEAMRIAKKQASPALAGLPVLGAKTAGGK